MFQLQRKFKLFEEKELSGAFLSRVDSTFTLQRWFSGNYQRNKEKFIEEHTGFRNTMARIRNQIDFSIFNQLNLEDAFIGKENYIFSLGEMYQINGAYNRFSHEIIEDVEKLKMTSDFLASHGIPLIIVLNPGKAYYYSKYIPERWYSHDSISCYKTFLHYSKKYGLKLVDLNAWYMQISDTTKYPLYPKTGIHWSIYGIIIGLDTIMKSIAKYAHKKMPRIKITSIKSSNIPNDYDADIMISSNLLFDIPSTNLAYPTLEYDTSSGKPNLLWIGDSYFNSIYRTGQFDQVSNDQSAFWYYCREGSTKTQNNISVKELNLLKELEGRDAVILMYSPPNLYHEIWKFSRMMSDVLYKKNKK